MAEFCGNNDRDELWLEERRFHVRSRDFAFHSGPTGAGGSSPRLAHMSSIHSFIRNTTCPSDVSPWRWDERKRHDGSVHRAAPVAVSIHQMTPILGRIREWCWRESVFPSLHPVLPIVPDVGATRSNRATAFSSFRDRYWPAPGEFISSERRRAAPRRRLLTLIYPARRERERERMKERERNARGRRSESGR